MTRNPPNTQYELRNTNGHNLLFSEEPLPAQYRLKRKTLKAYVRLHPSKILNLTIQICATDETTPVRVQGTNWEFERRHTKAKLVCKYQSPTLRRQD